MLRLRSDAVEWREVGGEALLLDLRSSNYLVVNPSATVLWRRLAKGTTRDELVAALAEEYGLPVDQVAGDVDAFLADCKARELIEEHND